MRKDLENKMKYERDMYDSGIHCSALRALVEATGHDLLSYTPRLTDEADYVGVDGYFSIINPKTHKCTTMSVDFKFRNKDYGDVLYNWVHRNGGPGWACNSKKVNDVVVNVVESSRVAHMTTRNDMVSAFDYMNKKPLVPTPDGQKNVIMSITECKEHFKHFIGPVKF